MESKLLNIKELTESTSYERIYKKIITNLYGEFSIGLGDYVPQAYSECYIIKNGFPTLATLALLPEDITFNEYMEHPIVHTIPNKPFYHFLCHENSCFFVNQKEEKNLDDMYAIIKNAPSEFNKTEKKVRNVLRQSLIKHFPIQEKDFCRYIKRSGLRYEFTSDFYDIVFGKIDNVQICRYSSLRSFFDILNNHSIRMCALPGMNDTSEGSFAYNYIHKVPQEKEIIIKEKRKRILNQTLILSFCEGEEKIDELTQWRLYGDNARGVCCEYAVDGVLPNNFLFGRTIYDSANSCGTLEKLKKINGIIEQTDSRFYVNCQQLYPFFKPKAYSIENEIRLLYEVKPSETKWMLTQEHSIINAYKDILLKDFPLKLKRVILGPKMPNKETNKYQIKRMLECIASQDENLDYLRFVKVELSTINCYR